ncbi:hypothetical protein A3842_11070 [Paenibacillus sp. P3E]|nr:hypothetical protein A3842_11070 [Paenibacillus sp. P3E]
MWDAAGIEEIYKYKNRIKVFKRPGLVSYELLCDLTYRMFQDVYDTANDDHTTAEEAKVSVKVLLAALGEGAKES